MRTLDGGMHAPVVREQLNSGILIFQRLGHNENQHYCCGSLARSCCGWRSAHSVDYCSTTRPATPEVRVRTDAFVVAPSPPRILKIKERRSGAGAVA